MTPVLHKAKNLKAALPLTKANPDLVGVVHKGEIFAAVVEKWEGDDYQLRVIGFSDKKGAGLGGYMPTKHTRQQILLSQDGPALMVASGGRWYPARLVGKENADYKIRYVASKDGEEVVDAERVRHLFAANPGEAFSVGMFRKK